MSLSLTDFEVAFQTLQFRLALKISNRLKTRFLGKFCIILQSRENSLMNHSYYQELINPFQKYLSSESLIYQPVSFHNAIYATLRYLALRSEFETDSESFQECMELVRVQLVTSLINLSEYEESIRIACEDYPAKVNLEKLSSINTIAELCEEIKRKEFPDEVIQMFQTIRDQTLVESTGFSSQKIWIPLVEKFEDTPSQEVIVGTIYPLSLDIEARLTDRSIDIIAFNNHPIGRNDLVNYQAQDAMSAARNEHKFLSKPLSKRFTVRFGFPSTEYSFSGSSFGFGMALLALCMLGREANLRKHYLISKSTAVTGGIDLNGQVRAVNPQGLEEKISAAFYSTLSAIVIPGENLVNGQVILDGLQSKHPRKIFSLIPENALPGILDNHDVVKNAKMPLLEWIKNHLTSSKIIQISLITIITVMITLGILSALTDPNPSDFKVEGETLLLFNNTGQHLWSVKLGHTPDYIESARRKKPIYRRLQIHDYDGDGENEVILGTAVKRHEFNGQLMYLETDGQVAWNYSEHPILKFGEYEYTNNYGVHFIYPYKHEDSQEYDIYARFSHMPWFPNRLARFNLKGELLDEFIHPGSINDMEFIDLDNNGEMEIILGGTNNGFNAAAIAILPSRNYGGTTPLWESNRILEGWGVDSNLIYIKFPHWGIYDPTGTNSRSHVDDVFLDSDQGFIVSVVLGDVKIVGSYLYNFDKDLNLIGLSVSDGFFALYHKQFGKKFFDKFDRKTWYHQMTQLDIWKDGSWRKLEGGK